MNFYRVIKKRKEQFISLDRLFNLFAKPYKSTDWFYENCYCNVPKKKGAEKIMGQIHND